MENSADAFKGKRGEELNDESPDECKTYLRQMQGNQAERYNPYNLQKPKA